MQDAELRRIGTLADDVASEARSITHRYGRSSALIARRSSIAR
jgi:hypothetical protein